MALSKKFLISTTFLKENTVVDINLDDEIIKPQIWEAQEAEIQRILGSKLYNKLMTLHPTFTGYYKILVDQKLSMCLAYYTLAYGVPFWVYEFGNKGIARKTSTNSEPITKVDIDYLEETFKKRAEEYGQRAIDYIRANRTRFPEYDQWEDGDMQHEEQLNYECPIAMGKEYPTNQELNYLNDNLITDNDNDE